MTKSEQIDKLAAALSKAQGAMRAAGTDSKNPFFNAKYTSLSGCWDACRGPLSENELAVIQSSSFENDTVTLETMLTHSSGQWVESRISCKPGYIDKAGNFILETDVQAVGSAITYLRRYALAPIVGITTNDDDGESNVKGKTREAQRLPDKPKSKAQHVKSIMAFLAVEKIPEAFVLGLCVKAKLCAEKAATLDDVSPEGLEKLDSEDGLMRVASRWMEKQDAENPLPEQKWETDATSQKDPAESTDQDPPKTWQEVVCHIAPHMGVPLGELDQDSVQKLFESFTPKPGSKNLNDTYLKLALIQWKKATK